MRLRRWGFFSGCVGALLKCFETLGEMEIVFVRRNINHFVYSGFVQNLEWILVYLCTPTDHVKMMKSVGSSHGSSMTAIYDEGDDRQSNTL